MNQAEPFHVFTDCFPQSLPPWVIFLFFNPLNKTKLSGTTCVLTTVLALKLKTEKQKPYNSTCSPDLDFSVYHHPFF